MENTMVNPTCLKSCPAMPSIKAMGRNTTIVVTVDATTEAETSFAPSMALSA